MFDDDNRNILNDYDRIEHRMSDGDSNHKWDYYEDKKSDGDIFKPIICPFVLCTIGFTAAKCISPYVTEEMDPSFLSRFGLLTLGAVPMVFGIVIFFANVFFGANIVLRRTKIDDSNDTVVSSNKPQKAVAPNISTTDQICKFFYTFHPHRNEPFKNGWVEVHAKNWIEADKKYRSKYSCDSNHKMLWCYHSYNEEMFKQARKYGVITGKCQDIIIDQPIRKLNVLSNDDMRKSQLRRYGTDDIDAINGIDKIVSFKKQIAKMIDDGINIDYDPRFKELVVLVRCIHIAKWEMLNKTSHPIWTSYGRCYPQITDEEEQKWTNKYWNKKIDRFFDIILNASIDGITDKELPDVIRAAYPNEPDLLQSHYKKNEYVPNEVGLFSILMWLPLKIFNGVKFVCKPENWKSGENKR